MVVDRLFRLKGLGRYLNMLIWEVLIVVLVVVCVFMVIIGMFGCNCLSMGRCLNMFMLFSRIFVSNKFVVLF